MRKTKTVVIAEAGRDQGKHFLLTEKTAYPAEIWFGRAMQLAIQSGVDIPANVVAQGAAGFAAIAEFASLQILAAAPFHEVKPLLDELMECIKIIRDPARPEMAFPLILDTDIEEIQTLIKLQREAIRIHINFSPAGSPSTSNSGDPASNSTNTKTSPPRSVRPSPRKPPRL